MPDILHRVGMQGAAAKVYEALATTEGLSHWWSLSTTGSTAKGGVVKFRFGTDGGCDMRVVESRPGEVVEWECVDGPPEWIGTHLTFRIEARGDETFVLFKHAGWREPVEFMHHCSTKWAVFLLSLKNWIERREGRPHPYDVKIHPTD
jgi:uncharacterized protein YndB with AHSA1/START domain